ncbi:MAG: M48 family metallopeptidase [Planctomycetota bacterium]
MDFFDHQERARRNTGRLVLLFGAAVLGTVLIVYGLVSAWMVAEAPRGPQGSTASFFDPLRLLLVGGGVGAVVGLASLYRLSQLSGGGAVVAEGLGGRLVSPNSGDPAERKLLNVVEEMSIASGVPMPPVYLMEDEAGINAFAAGFKPDNAVLGFTRGCIEQLDREELQGVVAHEFSHVLNGDMRLNLRLIGVLYGILVLGLIGQQILRISFYSGAGRRRGSKEGSQVPIVALALGLMVAGGIGTFFGRWIQSGISRQREFLADASAVQFTRDNQGIASALAKIAGLPSGSRLQAAGADEVSHMLFGEGTSRMMFSTHPPIPTRLQRLGFKADARGHESAASQGRRALAEDGAAGFAGGADETPMTPEEVGGVAALFDEARERLAKLPRSLHEAAGDSLSACAVVLGVALSEDEDERRRERERLDSKLEPTLLWELDRLAPSLRRLPAEERLPLVDLCGPALRTLTEPQARTVNAALEALITGDGQVTAFELALMHLVRRRLQVQLGQATRPGRKRLAQLPEHAAVLLWVLARAGHDQVDDARAALASGVAHLGEALPEVHDDPASQGRFPAALTALDELLPAHKRRLLDAAKVVIHHDREVQQVEAELYRAVIEALGCPAPPGVDPLSLPALGAA